MPLLAIAREKHSQLEIQIMAAFNRVDLAKGDADLAVRMARPEEPSLVGRRAFECGWSLYAAATYIGEHGRPARLEDLPKHPLVLYAELMHKGPPLRWLEDYRRENGRFSRVDGIEVAAQMLLAGSGTGLLPCFIGDCTQGLERVLPEPVTSNTGWIVYHESLRNTPRIRVIVDDLVEYFEQKSTYFSGRRDVETRTGA